MTVTSDLSLANGKVISSQTLNIGTLPDRYPKNFKSLTPFIYRCFIELLTHKQSSGVASKFICRPDSHGFDFAPDEILKNGGGY